MEKNTGKNKEQSYCQCLLRKRSGNISILDVSWIPVEYGIIGKFLKFWKVEKINKDDSYDGLDNDHKNSWVVIKVYEIKSENDIIEMGLIDWDYKKWNEVCDNY